MKKIVINFKKNRINNKQKEKKKNHQINRD